MKAKLQNVFLILQNSLEIQTNESERKQIILRV